jgi:hypothetical protein
MSVSMPDRFFLGAENVVATSANAGHESEMPAPREGAADTNTTPAGVVKTADPASLPNESLRPMSMTTRLAIAAGVVGIAWMLYRTSTR